VEVFPRRLLPERGRWRCSVTRPTVRDEQLGMLLDLLELMVREESAGQEMAHRGAAAAGEARESIDRLREAIHRHAEGIGGVT
jgi:hypothetical protein